MTSASQNPSSSDIEAQASSETNSWPLHSDAEASLRRALSWTYSTDDPPSQSLNAAQGLKISIDDRSESSTERTPRSPTASQSSSTSSSEWGSRAPSVTSTPESSLYDAEAALLSDKAREALELSREALVVVEAAGECDVPPKGSKYFVGWDGEADSQNPVNWSQAWKWGTVALVSTMTLIVNLATVMCAPAVPAIMKEFKSNDSLSASFVVSVWELGETVGPLLYAPLSEVFGRQVVFNVANVFFIAFQVLGGRSSSVSQVLMWRFLCGLSVASSTLNSSIVGDMFEVGNQRNIAVNCTILGQAIGPVIGPIIGGFMAESASWRWTFYLSAILAGSFEAVFFFAFKETYKPVVLRRKANAVRRKTGSKKYRCEYAHPRWRELLSDVVLRPGRMLIHSRVVLVLALYTSLVFGYIYLMMASMAQTFEKLYGLSTGKTGLCYLGMSIGIISGNIVAKLMVKFLPSWLISNAPHDSSERQPESHLPPMLLGTVSVPAGLLIYGWTAHFGYHVLFPIFGSSLVGMGIAVTLVPSLNYAVDVHGIYGASAVAALGTSRCFVAGLLPLAYPPLHETLGLGWSNTLLALIAVAFIPVPVILMKYARRIRIGSRMEIIY